MEYETIMLILAFLIGWVGHAVYSFVFNLGRTAYFVHITCYSMVCLAKLTAEQVTEFLQIKYKSLDQLGIEKNKIKLIVNEDRIAMDMMKQTIVKTINKNYPKPFTHQIDFNNWNQMMDYISDNHRRNNA